MSTIAAEGTMAEVNGRPGEVTRRAALRKAAAAGATIWATPMLLSSPAGAQGSDPTTTTGPAPVFGAAAITGSIAQFQISADNGQTWSPSATPSPTVGTLADIDVNGSTVVLTGSQGLRSPDGGSTWANVNLLSGGAGQIEHTASSFVAVGAGTLGRQQIRRSTDDGVTWTTVGSTGLGVDSYIADLRMSGSIGIAAVYYPPSSGRCYTLRSTDSGASWVLQTFPANTGNLKIVLNDGATWVGLNNGGGTRVRSTDDGATWTVLSPTGVLSVEAAATNGSTFVSVGRNGAIARSTDSGSSWSTVTSPTTFDLWDVAYVAGAFWAVGSGVVLRSTNGGATWSLVTAPANDFFRGVSAVGSTVMVISSSRMWSTTDDGATWTARSWPAASGYTSVAGTASKLIAVTSSPSSGLQSFDGGAIWSQLDLPSANAIAASRPTWILVRNTEAHRSLDDGVSWTSVPTTATSGLYGIANYASSWVAVGISDITTSIDNGATWSAATGPGTWLSAVATDGTDWVAVGRSGVIARTAAPVGTWLAVVSGTTQHLNAVATDGSTWIAVGNAGTILRSTDGGQTWQTVASGTTQSLSTVAGVGGEFLAASGGSVMLRSTDSGLTWGQVPTSPGGFTDLVLL